MIKKIKIAILVPSYKEEKVIDKTIVSLLKAGFLKEDIYIVDDCSKDETSNIALSYNVNVLTLTKNSGKAGATKSGFDHFNLIKRYDWVTLVDGDSILSKDFISVLKTAIKKDSSPGLYVGQVVSIKNNSIFSTYRAYEYTYGHEIVKKGQDNFGTIFVSPGCCSVYRTNVLKQLDISSDTLAEDMDLTIQTHRLGYRVRYLHDLIAYTQDPNNLKDFYKQITRWYRGFWQIMKKHKVLSLTQWSKVDIYLKIITIDAVIFNRIFMTVFVLALFDLKVLLIGMSMDYLLLAAISIYAAILAKNWRIFFYSPIFYFIGLMNSTAYLKAFVEVFIFGKIVLSWNKVKRY
jgi:cellulose synthase/poly-beta-1,6-N-acetylglucosamine synthase-like glycosyltransferase